MKGFVCQINKIKGKQQSREERLQTRQPELGRNLKPSKQNKQSLGEDDSPKRKFKWLTNMENVVFDYLKRNVNLNKLLGFCLVLFCFMYFS